MSADFSALRQHIEQRSGEAFTTACDETLVEMMVRSPYLTGETVESGAVTPSGPLSASLGFTTPQSLFTDQGTQPHEITGSPLLSFNVGGKQIIVHSVQHPGTPRTGWFSDYLPPTFTAQIERWLAALL